MYSTETRWKTPSGPPSLGSTAVTRPRRLRTVASMPMRGGIWAAHPPRLLEFWTGRGACSPAIATNSTLFLSKIPNSDVILARRKYGKREPG